MKVGIGLKPGTKVDVVTEWVDQGLVDMVLVMTVEPGFGGQSFMGGMMSKVEALRKAYPTLDIEVDGGVGPKTIDACAAAGANMIVSGGAFLCWPALRISFDDISFCRYRVIFEISLKYRYRIFFENITRYLIMKYLSILAFQ